jgi:hypothetical protein
VDYLEIAVSFGKHLRRLDVLLLNGAGHDIDGVLGHDKKVITCLTDLLDETGELITTLDKDLVIRVLVDTNKSLLEDRISIVVKENGFIIFLCELGGGEHRLGTGEGKGGTTSGGIRNGLGRHSTG